MSGIVGVVNFNQSRNDPLTILQMLAQIPYRGPDASGIYSEQGTALGHTRLSVIDLESGQQPMHNEDRSLWVTSNSEIFNYVELKEELTRKGHRFETRSDTEVILHLYEEYGESCVERFNGQWAFAVWDARRGRLFVSRDRLGVRPLFYTVAGRKFIFGSEIKALFAHPDVSPRIDPRGLNQMFTFQSTVAPTTVFEGICELPPGHNLVVEDGWVRLERYWQLDNQAGMSGDDESQSAQRLLELLTDATRLRLRSDVPVGSYLGGSLESSLITAIARQSGGADLKTFSVSFDDARTKSHRYDRELIEALGNDHAALECSSADVARVFAEMIWHAERPVLKTASASMYLLSKLVSDSGYKVVLTGEGTDEVLGRHGISNSCCDPAGWEPASPHSAIFSPDFRAALSGHMVYADRCGQMPGGVLSSQGDRMAMAHSVVGRFPMLDHRLAEFAAQIPPRLDIQAPGGKSLLQRAAEHIVPDAVIQCSRQPYRGPDAANLIGHDYFEELLSPGRITEDGIFDPDVVQGLVAKVRNHGTPYGKANSAVVGILSTQLVVDQFVRNFPGPGGRPSEPKLTATESTGCGCTVYAPVGDWQALGNEADVR